MGTNRAIVTILLGYIIGILWGLYLNISIVFLYLIIFLIFKIISFTRIFKYVKLLINTITIILIIISSLISNLILINQNKKYENLYRGINEVEIIAKVIDNGIQKEYTNTYKIKIELLNNSTKHKNTYVYLNCKDNLQYGDLLHIKGSFEEPDIARNYKGFNYKEYLKTEKVYGNIKSDSVTVIKKYTNSKIFTLFNNFFLKMKEGIELNFEKDTASILLGILLGYTEQIDERIKQDFSESNISHILAVSGMHISYLIIRSNIYYR